MSDLSGRSFVGVQMLLSPCHVYYWHIYRVLNLFMDPFSRPYDFTLLHFQQLPSGLLKFTIIPIFKSFTNNVQILQTSILRH